MPRLIPTLVIAALLVPAIAAAQLSVTDDLGRTIHLPAPAQRIISLAPSVTESLFALGAGDQVCGVTDQCTYPDAAKQKPRVGGMVNPGIETIIGLHPDLIVFSKEGNTRADYDRLVGLGSTVFVSDPRTLDGIRRSIAQLGILTGHTDTAERLALDLKAREDSVQARNAGPGTRTLLLVSLDPLIAAGKNTFIDDLLRHSGALNVAATAPGKYPALSREAVLMAQPDVILITSDLTWDIPSLLAHFPEWSQLHAAQKGKIYRIDPDLVSRPGPRAFDGLERLSSILHPKP